MDKLNISAISGSGVTFVDQLADKLSSLADSEIADLFAKMKAKRGDFMPAKNYAVITPKLPSFSGNSDKTGNGYDQWRSQLKTIMSDQSCSDSHVLNAIHQSVRGTAADVLLSLPDGSKPSDILDKFDKYFGNILPLDVLTHQFHTSQQEPNESVVNWSCRLQKMLDLIHQKRPMPKCEMEQLLRSKFWNGLYSSFIKDATRHRYDNAEEFEEILT